MHRFVDFAEAQQVLTVWQEGYNNRRPHISASSGAHGITASISVRTNCPGYREGSHF